MYWLLHFFLALVILLHFWFLTLEMFLWQKTIGLKTFGNTKEKAKLTAVLAANQGLYNGFLAMGLFCSYFFKEANVSFYFRVYFLICIIIAGIYGGFSANRRILFIQSFPALIALILTFINRTY